MNRLQAIHTTGGLDRRLGGLASAVTALCSAVAQSGADVDLVSGVNKRHDLEVVLPASRGVGVHAVSAWQLGRIRYYPEYADRLRELLSPARGRGRVLHDHGLWGHFNRCAWRASRRSGVPYVLSPHGMIAPWALAEKRWKKRLAMLLFQQRILESAELFIATGGSEYESIRQAALKAPVAVLPLGVDSGAFAAKERVRLPENTTRTALFLSRIHPVKGVLILIEAWARVAPASWRLLIAGPDEQNHLHQVRQSIRRHSLEASVTYVGPVQGSAKWDLYRSAELFVLPTFSENFGMVVAEALACGVPVITTRGAPWADLVPYRCGWWIDVGAESLTAALGHATSMNTATLRAMGKAGQAYARRYDWARIGDQLLETYQWLVYGGPRPEWVHIE